MLFTLFIDNPKQLKNVFVFFHSRFFFFFLLKKTQYKQLVDAYICQDLFLKFRKYLKNKNKTANIRDLNTLNAIL